MTLAANRKRVFDSVFPPAPLSSISPTPVTSPVLGFSNVGESFSSPVQRPPSPLDSTPTPEPVIWDRAWHNATAYLSVPDIEFDLRVNVLEISSNDEENILQRWRKGPPAQSVLESIHYVGSDASEGKARRPGLKEYDLKEWYMDETRRHFLTNFRDFLREKLKSRDGGKVLHEIVRYLRLAQRIYYTPFVKYISPLLDPTSQIEAFTQLQRSIYAIVNYSLPSADTSYLLAEELATEGIVILGIHIESDGGQLDDDTGNDSIVGNGMDIDQKYSTSYKVWKEEPSAECRLRMMMEGESAHVTETRNRLLQLLEGLQDAGLGGSKAQKVFAGVMNNMMTEFVASAYAGQWESPSLITEHLRQWTENVFARLVVQVLHILRTSDTEADPEDHLDVTLKDVEKWQEMGVARLGALRISELFDIIVEWDSSSGAIEDLKKYTTNPATRFNLTSAFTATLIQRLLQPGASTIEILQVYISIIRAFTQLDPRGVLLDRVARPIRRYLRDREDTVKVIVGGLLADAVDAEGQPVLSSPDTLVELATELSKAQELALRDESGELDWDDMNWMPDPIDAAPDYKKSKNSDVIGSLMSLFDSKETFVKELQKVLGERLLKKSKDFEQEISVLELLKLRFGDSALQACEVMLRDVLDSKRVDAVIRTDQKLETANKSAQFSNKNIGKISTAQDMPDLHAKILSRLFWPTLQNQTFKVPGEITALQVRYAAGFESLKQSRKLTWLNGIGQVTVELDLEDRVFKDEVTTWQASVIYAFQSSSSSTNEQPVSKTISELSQQLEMSASLVCSACLFWVSKRILVETQCDTFRVLEVILDEEDEASQLGESGADAATGASSSAGAQHAGAAGTNTNSTAAAAAAEAAEAAAAKESADAAAMAKMDLYWQFIMGMLTNQGAMPLQRIIMMLKIAVPGGFPFSSEDLREFLGQMVVKGKLEILSGGNYKIV
ncbi:hypothetical protein AJ80_08974 [Polytolypa hystricis UAMH7299]|uniref:Anaphase-promoting complex subunit 2 n=1 Tax=Polytolypa hystricis (strain UAMH7299) TaxID=1447883 RepID=A0A2B7WYR0_POLH7|nr:hypothetical protein AJ80_08974 [Polytolypa hystricis UAMH7299]